MKTLALCLVTFFYVASAAAQPLVESIDVRVLEIDTVVTDRSGNPVADLEAGDFEVLLNGKHAEITNFFSVRRGEILREADEQVSAYEEPAKALPSTLVLFIDDGQLHQSGKARVLEALQDYIGMSTSSATSMMVLRWNRSLEVRVPPTLDRDRVLLAIEEMKSEPSSLHAYDSSRRQVLRWIDDMAGGLSAMEPDEVWQQVLIFGRGLSYDVERTISALREVVRLASGFEGRTTLLYVSEGLPLHGAAEVIDYWARAMNSPSSLLDMLSFDHTRAFKSLIREAQASNVVFSAVDPSGLRGFEGTGAESGTTSVHLDSRLIRDNARSGMRMVADETGGKVLFDKNDLGQGLAVLDEQMTTYYSIGVQPTTDSDRLLNVSVRVPGRPDLVVNSARKRSLPTKAEDLRRTVVARLYSKEETNQLGALLQSGAPEKHESRCVVPIRIIVPDDRITWLPTADGAVSEIGVHFAILDDRYQESKVESVKRRLPERSGNPFVHTVDLGLGKGSYTLSVAVVDEISGVTSYLQKSLDTDSCGR